MYIHENPPNIWHPDTAYCARKHIKVEGNKVKSKIVTACKSMDTMILRQGSVLQKIQIFCKIFYRLFHGRVFAPKCASCNQPILPAQVSMYAE